MHNESIAVTATEPEISDLRAMLTTTEPVKEPAAKEAPAAAEPAKTEPASGSDAPEGKERGADGKFKPAAKTDESTDADSPNVQARISKLVKAQREAERERDELREKLAAGSQPVKAAEPASEGPPDVTKFDTYEEYLEAKTNYQLDQRDLKKANAEAAVKNAERARVFTESWKVREAAATLLHPDYDEVIAGAAAVKISREMHVACVESDIGPQLMYHLASHPEEAARINALSPNASAREMGKLEKLLEAAPAAVPSIPVKAAKALPRPAANVGGSHAPADVDLNDPDLDMATFKREFRKRQNTA